MVQPFALNLDATLSHYLEYGQTWERAMLIKARAVAGDMALGQAFIDGVAPLCTANIWIIPV
ncbi:MAG: hypothetical protein Q9N67_03415 [Ghiorsea sp.]|nr:hypothetical protein [Ghiorsea sp.]